MKALDLREFQTSYIDAQTLLHFFSSYAKPRERILRLVKNGELVRLKSGFYLIAEKAQQRGIPYEQIANMLYGPSYVSFEWALSFYGMIPEKVHTVTSATLGRKKTFQTPIGTFLYHPVPKECYPIGVTLLKASTDVGGFLIASPEKALADLIFKTYTGLNKENLLKQLVESQRISLDRLRELDKSLLSEIALSYRSKQVREFMHVLGYL